MAIMPCTAKKMEAARAEFTRDGQPDVDLVITTRELVDMIREAGIQLTELEPEAPDLPFGLGSGAAALIANRLLLGCAEGVLEVTEVKPDGKRAMDARSFAAGVPALRGEEGTWSRA